MNKIIDHALVSFILLIENDYYVTIHLDHYKECHVRTVNSINYYSTIEERKKY